MKPSIEEVQSLLALKRHETPPEEFAGDFLREFHQRRREEAMRPSGLRSIWNRFILWFEETSGEKWVYGGGLAYAALLLVFIAVPRTPERAAPEVTPTSYQVLEQPETTAMPVEQLEQLDLRPSSEGKTGEQEF